MQFSLRPNLEKFVEEKVKSGRYTDASEAINDALEALKAQDELPTGEELRRLVAEGQADLDRGDVFDGPSVFKELLERSAARHR